MNRTSVSNAIVSGLCKIGKGQFTVEMNKNNSNVLYLLIAFEANFSYTLDLFNRSVGNV